MHHRTGPHAGEQKIPSLTVDPIFYPPPQRFRYPPGVGESDLGAWLAQQVSLDRRRLHLHLQRIVLHAEQGTSEQLTGALVDLFITLGGAGKPLRQRLLRATRNRLASPMARFLQQHLDSGLQSHTPLPTPLPWARLSAGLSGVGTLVGRERPSTAVGNPLELARQHLDDGNISQALTVLEQALMSEPDNAALQAEMLTVCRATRDIALLRKLATHLALSTTMADQWQQTIVQLEQQEIRA